MLSLSCPPNSDVSFINPHQRCGYSDLPFVGILFFAAGSTKGLEGLAAGGGTRKKKLFLRIHNVVENYVRDINWDQQMGLHLLESILMKPSDF